jgi:hypothetical protein
MPLSLPDSNAVSRGSFNRRTETYKIMVSISVMPSVDLTDSSYFALSTKFLLECDMAITMVFIQNRPKVGFYDGLCRYVELMSAYLASFQSYGDHFGTTRFTESMV